VSLFGRAATSADRWLSRRLGVLGPQDQL